MLPLRPLAAWLFSLLIWAGGRVMLEAEAVDVSAKVSVTSTGGPGDKSPNAAGAVVWLTPAQPSSGVAPQKIGHYKLTQKDKQFTPHLLVIPTGSTVEFPNLDPFFHNVFSLFDGKRFDLGLYESHTTRTVHFNRDGISYIFCNIHPEMSAIIMTLPAPWWGISANDGAVAIQSVPAGSYDLHVWMEGVNASDLQTLGRKVLVSPSDNNLGIIAVRVDVHRRPHKNKFGEDYQAPDDSIY